jgi:hypothetical protein
MASSTWIISGSGGMTAWVASSTNIARWHKFSARTSPADPELLAACGPDALRADLDRFTFLPGGDDGEFLLGEGPP